MAITVRDLITSALISCDAIATGEPPDAAESFRGLQLFNDRVALLSLDNLWDYTITLVDGATESGKSIYSVGDTVGDEDFLTPRPPEIVTLTLKQANVWYPLKQVSPTEFQNTTRLDPQLNRYTPSIYTYRPDFPVGTLEVYPTPSGVFDLKMQTREMKTEYTLDDELTLPVGYQGYLMYALAAILAVDYGVPQDRVAELNAISSNRLATIKRQNFQPRKLKIPFITRSGRNYDILSDRNIRGVN